MSGRDESCLVTWQLEKQTKKVTARIGAPIQHIRRSDDGQYLAVTFVNNQLHVYSAETSYKKNAILGFSRGQTTTHAAYDPSTKCIVAVGYPAGILQFYRPSEDRLLKSVDVVGENRVNKLKNEVKYEDGETVVKQVGFSQDGSWMVTAEHRRDKLLGDERKLKFWKYDDLKEFQLNTLVDPPHTEDLTTLVFQPMMTSDGTDETKVAQRFSHADPGKCLTACCDGEFKLWSLETSRHVNKEGVTQVTQTWVLHAIGKHIKEPIKEASFSHDGKMIATVQSEITVWSLEPRLQVVTTLGTNTLRENISHATFGSHSDHLVGHTQNYILCWSTQSFSLMWCVQATAYSLSRDPFTECFIALAHAPGTSRGGLLNAYVFKGDSPQPITSYNRLGNRYTCLSLVHSTVFLPRSNATPPSTESSPSGVISNMYAISADSTISRLGEWTKQKRVNVTSTKLARQENENNHIFKLKINPKKFVEEQGEESKANTMKGMLSNMLTTPSHILPSMGAMFKAYATVSMISNQGKKTEGQTEGTDSESDDEVEGGEDTSDDEAPTQSTVDKQQTKQSAPSPISTSTSSVADVGSNIKDNSSSQQPVNLEFNFKFQTNLFS